MTPPSGDEIKWTIDDSDPRQIYNLNKHILVDPPAMLNYFSWRRAIRGGMHPADAAKIDGNDLHFEKLQQKITSSFIVSG